MSDLNNLSLTGHLVADAKKSIVNGNVTKVEFTLCANNYFNKEDYASYFYLACFGVKAENIFQYLKKGQLIGIEGMLKQDRWEKDGNKMQRIEIVIQNLQLLGGAKKETFSFEPLENEMEPPTFDFPPEQ